MNHSHDLSEYSVRYPVVNHLRPYARNMSNENKFPENKVHTTQGCQSVHSGHSGQRTARRGRASAGTRGSLGGQHSITLLNHTLGGTIGYVYRSGQPRARRASSGAASGNDWAAQDSCARRWPPATDAARQHGPAAEQVHHACGQPGPGELERLGHGDAARQQRDRHRGAARTAA